MSQKITECLCVHQKCIQRILYEVLRKITTEKSRDTYILGYYIFEVSILFFHIFQREGLLLCSGFLTGIERIGQWPTDSCTIINSPTYFHVNHDHRCNRSFSMHFETCRKNVHSDVHTRANRKFR